MKYKYIIYKIYSWTASKRNDTPIGNTILALAVAHFFQALTLLLFIDRIITPLNWLTNISKATIYIGGPIYLVGFYFLIYSKKRWEGYVEEYSSESEQQRKRGNRLVIAYLVGSVLLFFILLPVFFTLGKYLHGR